jgi:hypothetical protein
VRAWLTVYDPSASGNRHIDLNNLPPRPLEINPRHSWVPDCKRRRIDLRSLIADVVVSPWAEADPVEEIDLSFSRSEARLPAESWQLGSLESRRTSS